MRSRRIRSPHPGKFFIQVLDQGRICVYYELQQILSELFKFRFGFVHNFFKTHA